MIKSVTVTNYLDESLTLELTRPEKSGIIIKEITGLGPPKANINVTEVTTSDGALFNSARANSRNIVMTLAFLTNPTIEDVRHLTYKYFPLKKKLKLTVDTDKRHCVIYGYVESNEPNIFTKQETAQISIVCPDPFFYSEEIHTTIFYGVLPMFEFPFSNESLTEKLIIFGELQNNIEQTILYEGDSEIGVVIHINFLGMVTDITIANSRTREVMKIITSRIASYTGQALGLGDEIIISTVKGDKYIHLIRDGQEINILNCLDKDADWFQLAKGDNIFAYDADEGISNIQFRIENKIMYEGI